MQRPPALFMVAPGEVVGDDPVGRWDSQRQRHGPGLARRYHLDRVVDSAMGPRPIRAGLAFQALDLHVHAWDLDRAVGVDFEIVPEVQEFVRDTLAPMPPEMVRSEAVFGPERPVPEGTTPTEAFIAWTGRAPR